MGRMPESYDSHPVARLSRYSLLAATDVPSSRLHVDYDPSSRPELTPSQRAAMDVYWEALKREGRTLKDGPPLYRFLGFRQKPGGFRISLGQTTYKEYLGSNVAHPEWRKAPGPQCMSDAIAVTGVAVTLDGRLPLQKRSALVAEFAGAYAATPSGHPHPPASLPEALMLELEEELGVKAKEVAGEPRFTGLVLETRRHKAEAAFIFHVGLTWEEAMRRTPVDAWEWDALEPLEWAPEPCARFLIAHMDDTVPQSHGTLLLGGRADFGEAWFRDTVRLMGGVDYE